MRVVYDILYHSGVNTGGNDQLLILRSLVTVLHAQRQSQYPINTGHY